MTTTRSLRPASLLLALPLLCSVGCVMDNPKHGQNIGHVFTPFVANGRFSSYVPGTRVEIQARNILTGSWEPVAQAWLASTPVRTPNGTVYTWQTSVVLLNPFHWDRPFGINNPARTARLRAMAFVPGQQPAPLVTFDLNGNALNTNEVTINGSL